jgi:hypothetical protein
MASEKKSLPLRISPELWADLKAWAEQDMRSLNAQIEVLLRESVERRKRGTASASSRSSEGAEGRKTA